jgi:lysophospholipase
MTRVRRSGSLFSKATMTLASTSDNPAPPGAIEEDVQTADGVRLRTVRWKPRGEARGAVAIFGGRGEFVEKYFEVANDLLRRGFAVAALDWRGQGGSDRLLRNARKGHVDDFSLFERDLDAFVAKVLEPHCPRPWFGLGHSMGAAVLLLLDEGGRCPFERLVLTSPMIAVKGVDHRGPTRYLVGTLDALGLGGAFAPRSGAETYWLRPFEGNVFTTDAARFARIAALTRTAPHLFLGGPTIGWTHAAFRAMNRFDDPNFPRRANTPILIVASGADQVTDTAAAERFAARLRGGRIIVIEGAEHEIMIERDALRDQFWAAFDAFVPGGCASTPRVAAAS